MKFLVTSLAIGLATSTALAAGPETSRPAPATAAQPAPGAQPSAQGLDLARRFIGMINPPENMMAIVREAAMQAAAANLESLEDETAMATARQQLERMLTVLEPQLRQQMPDLLEAYSQAYASEFSADELSQLIAFAATPAGKHYMARSALVDNDPLVLAAHQAMWADLAPTMERVRKELCSERAAQRLAAGETKAKCSLG